MAAGLKTRRQKEDAWKACARMSETWLAFLETVPRNQALTDREWFQGWRKFVTDNANRKQVPG